MFRYVRTKSERCRCQAINLLHEGKCFFPVIHHAAVDQNKVLGERFTLGVHTHEVYHLNLYTKTAGEFLIDDEFHPAETGSLVIVSPWEKHDFVTRCSSFEYSEITFSFFANDSETLNIPFQELLSLYTGTEIKLKSGRLKLDARQISQFVSILSRIIDFLESKTEIGEFNAYRTLASLIDFIILNVCELDSKQPSNENPANIVKSYIDGHFIENISLRTLAEISYLSEGHIIKLFKKSFKTTPLNYQTNLRIEAAKTLLKCSNLTCSQIAKRIGYDNNHYFHRLFKKNVGITPKQYRNSYVKGQGLKKKKQNI
ncbi:Arabinose operon regulatory protein [Limihaloglobus sulfuriphilus]|uniref:Arabinose operon regulatory protein n=2 Tax=Limihaloglobus sulfuriphilus TaxID=1851148 RepID=A0A1Q2MB01_9BACT|nr:Arabinose operon regulatory protein [Limihaloglobus sulfuriphilus]